MTTADGVGVAVRELRPARPRPGVDPMVLLHGARVPGDRLVRPARPRGLAGRGPGAADRSAGLPPRRARVWPLRPAARPVASRGPEPAALPLPRGGARRRCGRADGARADRGPDGHLARMGDRWPVGGPVRGALAGAGGAPRSAERALRRLGRASVHRAWLVHRRPEAPGPARPPDLGGYARADAASLLRPWDRSLGPDPAARRDPAVAEAYVREALASDPLAGSTSPPALRARSEPSRTASSRRPDAASTTPGPSPPSCCSSGAARLLEPPRGLPGVRARCGPRAERARPRDSGREPLPAPRARRGRARRPLEARRRGASARRAEQPALPGAEQLHLDPRVRRTPQAARLESHRRRLGRGPVDDR